MNLKAVKCAMWRTPCFRFMCHRRSGRLWGFLWTSFCWPTMITVRWALGPASADSRAEAPAGFSADFACLVMVMANWGNHRCLYWCIHEHEQIESITQSAMRLSRTTMLSWRRAKDVFVIEQNTRMNSSDGPASCPCFTNAFLHYFEQHLDSIKRTLFATGVTCGFVF